MLSKDIKKKLERMHYGIVGNHSAVQICMWTKKSLTTGEGCWKEKFYGVKSSGCCQMTPAVMWCENSCVHCWRPIEMNLGKNITNVDEPKEILDAIVKKRIELLEGFGGNKKVDKKKYEEAKTPSLYTMSLSGEPTIYPKIGEMFKEIRKRNAVSFLVTNGQNPEILKNFRGDELPTQITLSTNASNKTLFQKWHNSSNEDAWERFLESLDVLNSLEGKVRRVVRMTLVKEGKNETPILNSLTNMKEEHVKEYVDLILRANPDFVHIKGFKSIGYSRKRMGYDKQPWFEEIKEYSDEILRELNKRSTKKYKIGGSDERSCVVMLAQEDKELIIKKV